MLDGNDNITVNEKRGLHYIEFNNLKKYDDILTHCFTTRLGGVSAGECSSLNLSFGRRDSRENVLENYHRLAGAIGVDLNKMVLSNQVHDNKIRAVGPEDMGKGLVRESDIVGFDGLSTNHAGIPLVTFYADCVPVLILDPVKKAIAAVHSGWKGTVRNIAGEALVHMERFYQSDPGDLQIAIGPSICRECFEVDREVYELFLEKFPWCGAYTAYKNGKYRVDLQGIIKKVLADNGVPEQNIIVSGVCTKCNRDIFFSFRGDERKTGSLAALMMLKA